jgi:hypothetical protein
MKTIYPNVLLYLFSSVVYVQKVIFQNNKKAALSDSIVPGKGALEKQVKEIKKGKVKQLSDSIGNESMKSALVDTTVQNKYGDMLCLLSFKQLIKYFPFNNYI